MTQHLSSEEFVGALDGTLPDSRAAHLDACASCRTSLSGLRRSHSDLQSVSDVPEPSPLFWDHLSARVRAATDSTPVLRPASRWDRLWRPLTACAAAAAAVAVVVTWPTTPAPDPAAAVGIAVADDAPWSAIAELASAMSADDVRLVIGSAPETPAAVTDLTAAEREAFVRLLSAEMGGLQ